MLLTVWLLTFVSAGYQPDPLLYYSTAPAGHQVLWWGALALLAYAGTAIYGIVLGVKILLHELGHYPPEQGSEYDRCRI